MEHPFVWFDLRTDDPALSRAFYEKLLGWEVSDVPVGNAEVPMIGGGLPRASIISDDTDHRGWFPYVQVDELVVATSRALELGAITLQAPTEGPAGTYTPIREPGGAVFALFQQRI